MLDIYEIREKLKHEFGHLRQNYSQRDYDISQNRKFVVMDYEKVFTTSDKESEETLYDIVDEFMYIYSPSEIQLRYNELYQHMMDISQKDLEREISHYKKRNIAVAHFVELTDSISMLEHMNTNIVQMSNAIIAQELYVPLVLAYYFKTYNIWKTSNYISQKTVQDYLDEKISENQVRHIVNKFHFWLLNVVIRKYRHHIFSIIHYVLYSRVWGFEDSEQFGETFSEDKLSELQQNIKECKI